MKSYDDMGNQSAMSGAAAYTLEYDGFGMQRAIKQNSNTRKSYEYDYRARRTKYTNGATVNTYSYSGGTSVIDTASNGKTYLYRGPDMGGGVGGLLYTETPSNGDLSFKVSNHRGDVIISVNTDSTFEFQSEAMMLYNAFGESETYGDSGIGNYYKANTKAHDKDSYSQIALNYILDGYRYRDVNVGRYIQPDPLEYVDGFNCYLYCNNNPWTRFDPTGLTIRNLRHLKLLENSALGGSKSRMLQKTDAYGQQVAGGMSAVASMHPAVALNTAFTGKDAAGHEADMVERSIAATAVIPIAIGAKVVAKPVKEAVEPAIGAGLSAAKNLAIKKAPAIKSAASNISSSAHNKLTEMAINLTTESEKLFVGTNFASFFAGIASEVLGIRTEAATGANLSPISKIATASFEVGGAVMKGIKAVNEYVTDNKAETSQPSKTTEDK